MRILVLSDPHGGKWRVRKLIRDTKPDLIIVPGDIPNSLDFPILMISLMKRGMRGEYTKQAYYRFIERITFRQIRTAKRILEPLSEFPEIPVLLIHGNTETEEVRNWLRLYCHRFENFNWIADDSIEIDDYVFMGFGWVEYEKKYSKYTSPGETDTQRARLLLENSIKMASYNYSRNKEYILVSHNPPYGFVDYIAHKKIHAGSKLVREHLLNGTFKGVISGHLHEARSVHFSDKFFALNAGAVINDVACLLDLEKKNVTWYRNLVSPISLSKIIYRFRNDVNYHK
jgi:hypothetical protein